jgi:hypothetical protein
MGVCSFLVALFSMQVLGYATGGLFHDSTRFSAGLLGWVVVFFGVSFFSPIVETLALAGLNRTASAFLSPISAAILAAVILSAAHSLIYWAWGIIVLLPMIIFSLPFASVTRRMKDKMTNSFIRHAVHNVITLVSLVATTAS